jgi:hypothetical protein
VENLFIFNYSPLSIDSNETNRGAGIVGELWDQGKYTVDTLSQECT